MAIICSLCGKKQSGWISDFPLSPANTDIRICAVCNEKLEKLDYLSKHDIQKFTELSSEFQKLLTDNQLPQNVAVALQEVLTPFLEKERLLKEEISRKKEEEKEALRQKYEHLDFPMTSGYNFEGYTIEKYIRVISGESVLGTSFLSDGSMMMADLLGEESAALISKLQASKDLAMKRLVKSAKEIKANAIIGVHFNYINFSGNVVGVAITGTAVKINRIP